MDPNALKTQNMFENTQSSRNSLRTLSRFRNIFPVLILLCIAVAAAIAGIRPAAALNGSGISWSDPWQVTTWSELYEALNADGPVGYIKLQYDVKYGEGGGDHASSNLEISDGKEIHLDLNGKKIDRALNQAVMNNGCVIKVLRGTLEITDGSDGGNGTITGGKNQGNGGGVYVGEGGRFIMTGGTISGNSADYGGGLFVDAFGTSVKIDGGWISGNEAVDGGGVYIRGRSYALEFSSGTISGNNATRQGGGVYIDTNAYFKMTGGMIGGTTDQDKNTASSGGGVYIGSGTFEMTSGRISGNTASENGAGVYVGDTFKISGSPNISGNKTGNIKSNVWLPAGKTILVSGRLDNSASIGVTMKNGSGTFTSGLGRNGTALSFESDIPRATDMDPDSGEAAIRADDSYTFTISYDSNDGTGGGISAPPQPIGDSILLRSCSFSGRSCRGWNTRADRTGVAFTGGEMITPNGNMTLYAQWDVAEVNGERYMTLQGAVEEAGNGDTVTLLDNIDVDAKVCDQEGDNFGFPLLISSSKEITLDLNGFTIDRGLTEGIRDGYVIKISGRLTLKDSSASGDGPGTGKITGGYNIMGCGGVAVNPGGIFTMEGGTITGNNAGAGSGGGVYLSENDELAIAEFKMSGGQISSNMAGALGGGVYVGTGSEFTMTGGTISDNRIDAQDGKGGGVSVYEDGKFIMSGGTISGNKADYGGGVNLIGSTFNMVGGTVTQNTASETGGGVCMSGLGNSSGGTSDGFFIMSRDALITGNTVSGTSSKNGGGGVYVDIDSKFEMNGGTISSNSANYGGGIFINGRRVGNRHGTFTMYGGTVTENTTAGTGSGGGVYLSSDGAMDIGGTPNITANVTGGTVTGGILSGGTANNLFLDGSDGTSAVIQVNDALTASASIGITMANPGVFTSGLSGKGTAANFSSDSKLYETGLTTGNEAELRLKLYNVTVTSSAHGTVTSSHESADGNNTVTLTLAPSQDCLLVHDGLRVSYTDESGTHTVTVKADPGVDPVTGAGNWTFTMPTADVTVSAEFISTWTWLQSQLSSADSGSVIRLDRDIIWKQDDPAPLILDRSGVELTLDLNGHTINRGLAEPVDEGNVLTIKAGSLTLKDSSASGDDPGTGLITGGKSASNGGGVYVDAGGSFILEDGTISGNEAEYGGGGVYVWGSFTMKGGTISGNSASEYGGGVYVIGSFNLSGDSLITGSTGRNGAADNVYRVPGAFITVTGPLTGGVGSIGVNHQDGTGKIADGTAEYTISDSDRAVFSSDDPAMGIFLKEDNAVYLLYPLSIGGVSAKGKVYDGTAAAEILGTPVLTGVQSGYPVTLVTNSAAAVFADADAGQGKTVSFSGYSLSGDNSNKYHLAQPPDVTADITVRPLTVTAKSGQGKTFGAADPALTYTQEGLVGDDTISGTLARAEGENAGTYAITQGTLDAGNNYSISYTSADFTISKAAAQTLEDVTLSQGCNVTSVSVSLSGKMPEDAGMLRYTPGTPVVSGSQLTSVSGFTVDENGVVSASINNGEGNVTITLPVVISSTNYEDSTINVVVTLIPTYDVKVIPGANMTKTSDSGAESQTDLTGAMKAVVYTANNGYYFPENYSVPSVSGISVIRNSPTMITVCGIPAADVEITLADAAVKKKETNPVTSLSALFEAAELPATGFSSKHTTVLPEQPKELNYQPLRMRLRIPSLEMETDLVRVPLAQDAWQVKWLGNKAGLLDGSALPGEGYSVVAAHNTLNDTEYGPFAMLSTLEVNDAVIVSGLDGKVKLFRVYATELLDPNDAEELASIAEREANSLVLLTCENETADGGYLNRRAVFAKFIAVY